MRQPHYSIYPPRLVEPANGKFWVTIVRVTLVLTDLTSTSKTPPVFQAGNFPGKFSQHPELCLEPGVRNTGNTVAVTVTL